MKNKYSIFKATFSVLFIMGVSIELSLASSCKLFKDSFFRDRHITIHSNDKLSSLDRKMNNKTSSVMVPRNCKLVTFTGKDFKGAKQVYHENTEFVGKHFDDKISSAKCKCNKSGNGYNNGGNGYNNGGNGYNNGGNGYNNGGNGYNNGGNGYNNGGNGYNNGGNGYNNGGNGYNNGGSGYNNGGSGYNNGRGNSHNNGGYHNDGSDY